MAAELTDKAKRLLDAPNLAHFVTLMPDGSPQVTPVWVDHDGHHVLVNTAEGRQKMRNLRRDPRVPLSVVDRNDPYSRVEIRGRVVAMTREGGAEHINRLSHKYTGRDYPLRQGQVRVILTIEPLRVLYMRF